MPKSYGNPISTSVSVTADTEFPAAAALTDDQGNPTTTVVGAMLMLWDGAGWDRAPGDQTDGVYAQGAVAHDAADSGNPVKVGGKAQDPTSLPGAVAADDRADIMTDLYGRVVVVLGSTLDSVNDSVGTSPVDISHNNTTAAAASLVVKASAGKCFEIRGHNDSGSAQYIQVHDAASLPADTAVPEEVITVPADSNFSITFPQGKQFSTGIVVCNSSTMATKTIGAADCWFSADFE